MQSSKGLLTLNQKHISILVPESSSRCSKSDFDIHGPCRLYVIFAVLLCYGSLTKGIKRKWLPKGKLKMKWWAPTSPRYNI